MDALLLMLPPQQIIHRLDRVEGLDGDFDEDGVPVAHRAVPEAGQFEGLQFAAVFALLGDEAGILIYVIGQVEFLAFVILQGAHEVDGVEMRPLFEHRFLCRVAEVDLRTFEYLWGDCPVRHG